jgi:protein SCO1/2
MSMHNVNMPLDGAGGRRACLQGMGRVLALAAGGCAVPTWATGQPALPDVSLVNHDGRRARLLSDVWRNRVALVNFVFTSCASFCSLQSALLSGVQDRLAARLGREVVLISLTLDPLGDDPRRLADFSRPFQPGPHWWWLTGEAKQVFTALDALGADRGNPNDHSPVLLVGRPGAPRRLVGFPTLDHIEVAVLKELKT